MLERRNLAPSTISQHLSIVRALAGECTESGLLDQPTAVAVGRVNGVPIPGVSVGKWLTREQLLSGPPSTLMGLGDRAILSLLIGCGLRRDELANPLSSSCSSARGAGSLSIIVGKARRVPTVAVPGWARGSSTTGLGPRI